MNRFAGILLKGLATVLPLFITVYVLYWLAVSSEAFFGAAIQYFISDEYYWPGMGSVTALVLIMLIGILVNNRVGQFLIRKLHHFITHVPVANTIFNAVQDMMQFITSSRDRESMNRVVEITLENGIRVIGFITQETPDIPLQDHGEDLVGIYIPMSYMIGGFTIYVPRKQINPVNISMEKAMRLILTAGVTGRQDVEKPSGQ